MKSPGLRKPLKVQPPIVPVTDIIFSLIIFFMLMPSVSGGQGFLTTNLPTYSGAGPIQPPGIPPHINIYLDDVGPQGAYEPDGANAFCSIRYENQPLGDDFGALGAVLADKRNRGLDAAVPVVIRPTMACRHKWVVKTFDAIVDAGFSDVQFAVPYN
jgi:biopolymer transport protein ExbD